MRKVFLDELPRGGKCVNKNSINWKESIGYKVKFVYDNIEGIINRLIICLVMAYQMK